MPDSPIVYVIDDDEAARDSLAFLLGSAAIATETFESAVAFLGSGPKRASGCVITDVRMPDMTGIELLKRLRETSSPLPVIVITGHGDVPLAVEAMKAGAADFLEKPYDDEMMLEAVRSALTLDREDRQREQERAGIKARIATLSEREHQVLEGLVRGLPNKTIAFDYGISPRTVEVYRANVMTKMQARTLSDLVRMALVGGILGG